MYNRQEQHTPSLPVANYSSAIAKAVEWLGDRYLLAKPIDPAKKPVPIIKSTLLKSWIDYTHLILGEDQIACEDFQRGVVHATRQGWVGAKAEKRLAHFHKHWRKNMPKNRDEARRRKTAG